jgi:hypothetical protein
MVTDDIDAEDVEDAFECVWLWKDRMDETEEDVEFLPPARRPEERRYDDRGVCGCGETELRLGGGVLRGAVM